MLAQERHDQILWLINSEGTVKTSDLIKRFNVSLETIRRDLESLEKAGKLKRVYGGAIQKNPSRKFKNFNTREKEFSKEKIRIAEKALDIIEDGQAIALDSGTTNLILAKMLKGRFKHLTIVTNSMIIANELMDQQELDVILTGGTVSSKDYAMSGIIAEQVIGNFHFDICFISVSGVSIKVGITDYNLETVQIQRKLIESSQKVIVLADHRKFSTISMVKVCDFVEVNAVITDDQLDDKVLDQYREKGLEIL